MESFVRAVLEGEPLPCASPRLILNENNKARLEKLFSDTPPDVTSDHLRQIYADRPTEPDEYPEDLEWNVAYNALSPIDRALRDVLTDYMDNSFDLESAENPVFADEIRQAYRRTLERLLKMAEEAREKAPSSVANVQFDDPPAIRTAKALLSGRVPFAGNVAIPYDDQSRLHSDHHLELIFEPARMLDYYTTNRASLLEGLTFEEEGAVNAGDLNACSRLYEATAAKAISVLTSLVESAANYPTHRLLHRLCAACREELSELVAEWDELTKAAV